VDRARGFELVAAVSVIYAFAAPKVPMSGIVAHGANWRMVFRQFPML
jgi:hypothetical protein